jgi:hypothetical protein
MQLNDLQERLEALKRESSTLDAEIISIAAASEQGRVPARAQVEREADTHPTHRRYCATGKQAVEDAGGRKRAAVIRRASAAGAAFMAVVLVCTLASQPAPGAQHELLSGNLEAALKAVSPQLTEGEKKLFANDARRLAEEEALHAKEDRQRAAHLLSVITSTVTHNEQHKALDMNIAKQVTAHRKELADMKMVRRTLIRGTDGVVGHPQTVFKSADGVTQELAHAPREGLTKEIDEAFSQHLADEHAREAEGRKQRESRFMRERETAELARQSKERAVDDAREKYHDARKAVVKAKDALKDALADRDQMTEKVRAEGFISERQALAQLAPIQSKVKSLLQEVQTAKKNWEDAHAVLERAESIGTRPELSFPAPFQHHPVQQLALARKTIVHQEGGLPTASAAAASASSAAVEAATAASAQPKSAIGGSLPHASAGPQPHLMSGAQAMVAAARHRLAAKAAGHHLTGGLSRRDFAREKQAGTQPRTHHGADNVVPIQQAEMPGIFVAPEQKLALKP